MTLTVKLASELEQRLRQRAAASGRTASDVVREALERHLSAPVASQRAPSPYELGAHLFGRHRGPADLAATRKAELASIWAEKAAGSRGAAGAVRAAATKRPRGGARTRTTR